MREGNITSSTGQESDAVKLFISSQQFSKITQRWMLTAGQ